MSNSLPEGWWVKFINLATNRTRTRYLHNARTPHAAVLELTHASAHSLLILDVEYGYRNKPK